MKKIILLCLGLFLFTTTAQAQIVGREVEYEAGETTLKGYLAYDSSIEGPRPGVIVVHEWWGHNDYARQRARMLAELGYTALALDMYGDGKKAEHPDQAGEFSKAVMQNQPAAQKRFLAGMELLQDQPQTDPDRIAAIGYCFGGSTVLNMARQGLDLAGVVSFHGGLTTPTPAQPHMVNAEVLVLHGADDSFATEQQIEDFKEEMKTAGVDYQFVAYEGAKHSFTNPDADEIAAKFGMEGIAYNAEADRKSWERMKEFLTHVFAQDGAVLEE